MKRYDATIKWLDNGNIEDVTSNQKAPFQLNGYKIKWSKKDELWYVYKGKKQINVFQKKENARKFAELN